ncbi:uncharacterized protein K452DRAFT_111629 [Aplosporella prunicola CBS 121167]|uniref:Uncharacterized protein n=1 Tax=Aplosporella prunicola CBS 121167 TaxID=1176127 RepID=A0A6A6AZF6_9PEZI|nr:uncharacterized protein K452DRAFT_111629 [Aplosporella prunicola CBS 121167]KAF2137322.1 hypothetical protein K452DRAFT_111629 [Aplosporella prunicola CBS 121167]
MTISTCRTAASIRSSIKQHPAGEREKLPQSQDAHILDPQPTLFSAGRLRTMAPGSFKPRADVPAQRATFSTSAPALAHGPGFALAPCQAEIGWTRGCCSTCPTLPVA